MLIKIASLRALTGLSRTLASQGSFSAFRCHSTRLATNPAAILPRPVTCRNLFSPSSSQLARVIGNGLVQTRPQSTHGDHVKLWKLERIVSAAFLPLVPLCFILENPILDTLLALISVIHVHWGLEAIIIDYARPIVVGPVVPKVCFAALYLVSALTLAGLLVLIFNGPGISKVIKHGWSIGKDK